MTALVILAIVGLIIVVVLSAVYMNIKQIKSKFLLELCRTQKNLILDIEEKAMNYGYTDPLAYDIIETIRQARKKENA